MHAGLVFDGFGEEIPGEELGVFDLAIGTIFGDGSLVGDACIEDHVKGLEIDLRVSDSEEKLTGEKGAG